MYPLPSPQLPASDSQLDPPATGLQTGPNNSQTTTPMPKMGPAPLDADPSAQGPASQATDIGEQPPAGQPLDATVEAVGAEDASTRFRSDGSSPALEDAAAEPSEPITVWLAGDSTVANGIRPCPVGWGAHLAEFFLPQVTVDNAAVGGASVTNWLYHVSDTQDSRQECELERLPDGTPRVKDRWQRVLDNLEAGDYLLIQFGINDGNRVCPYHAGLFAFDASYEAMATAAKERGAQPVFVTTVSAIKCREGTAQPTRGAYVTTAQETGERLQVPVLDLHARSIELYAELAFCPLPGDGRYVTAETTGPAGDFFCDDNTHFASSGARAIAQQVAEAVREQGLPLARYLK